MGNFESHLVRSYGVAERLALNTCSSIFVSSALPAARQRHEVAERETVKDDSQGVQLDTIEKLAKYWSMDYDYRKGEAKLNAFPQFITEIDGLDIHFIHVKSKLPNALPMIVQVIARARRRAMGDAQPVHAVVLNSSFARCSHKVFCAAQFLQEVDRCMANSRTCSRPSATHPSYASTSSDPQA